MESDLYRYTSAFGQVTDPTLALASRGWVRYSDGYVEGRPDAIKKHWSIIGGFAESDVLHYGMNAVTYFDIIDEKGVRVRSFNTTLGQLLKHEAPAGVLHEPSEVQKFRRRPEVLVRRY